MESEGRTQASADPDDVALLHRIAEGDREAYRLLYDRYAGRLLVVLRQLCRDAVLAEDLLQEVFLAVWRRARTYRQDRGAPAGWLFAITRNKFFDHRRRAVAPSGEEWDPEQWPVSPNDRLELRISLEKALAGLRTEQRQALLMTYFGGYTYEETAERLRVPLGTLKSRLRAGLRSLRAELGGG